MVLHPGLPLDNPRTDQVASEMFPTAVEPCGQDWDSRSMSDLVPPNLLLSLTIVTPLAAQSSRIRCSCACDVFLHLSESLPRDVRHSLRCSAAEEWTEPCVQTPGTTLA